MMDFLNFNLIYLIFLMKLNVMKLRHYKNKLKPINYYNNNNSNKEVEKIKEKKILNQQPKKTIRKL